MLSDSCQSEAELFEMVVVIRKKIERDKIGLLLGCFIDKQRG